MVTLVIEVTEFNSKAMCDVRGCLEPAMVSDATKIAVMGSMHLDTRVYLASITLEPVIPPTVNRPAWLIRQFFASPDWIGVKLTALYTIINCSF